MDEKLEFIWQRRSIRQFTGEQLPDDVVRQLLEAAMAAPSACAKDPWHFVVVRDPAKLQQIADGLPYGKMLPAAACGIVVCGDLQTAHDGQLSYLLQDCSAAVENILLAANGLGFGSCWLGVHPREERIDHVRKLLSIPAAIIPVCVIAVGKPAERKSRRTRYKEDAIHFEAW